jgi:hypothetical protein
LQIQDGGDDDYMGGMGDMDMGGMDMGDEF